MFNEYSQFKGVKKVVGVWDFSSVSFKMGNVLLFNQHLHLVKKYTQADEVDLYIFCDLKKGNFVNKRLTLSNYRKYLQNVVDYFLLMETVDNIKLITSQDEINDLKNELRQGQYPIYPLNILENTFEFDYKSYLLNKDFLDQCGELDFAHIRTDLRNEASEIIDESFTGAKVISLHMRYDESFRTEANAKLDEWFNALKKCEDRYSGLKFLFCGNDIYPQNYMDKLKGLNNVFFAREMNLDIFKELALISQTNAFMGIASGPSNIPILSKMPYLIIKHPEDAWKEKFEEVENGERLPFAGKHQYFKIIDESSDLLLSYIHEVIEGVDK
jgi:hypothetical protein